MCQKSGCELAEKSFGAKSPKRKFFLLLQKSRVPVIMSSCIRILVAGSVAFGQPVLIGKAMAGQAAQSAPILSTINPTVIPGFSGFTFSKPDATNAPVNKSADTPPGDLTGSSQSGVPADYYSLLQDFVLSTDQAVPLEANTENTVPNGPVHAQFRSITKADGGTTTDLYTLLKGYLKAQQPDTAQSGPASAPSDALHAGLVGKSVNPIGPGYDAVVIAEGRTDDWAPVVHVAKDNKGAQKLAKDSSASYVGSQSCVKCHKSQFGAFAQTLHGKIFLQQPRNATEKLGCEGCHGPASQHIQSKQGDNGGANDIVGFNKESPRSVEDRNAVCLNCHEKADRTYWNGSTHESRGLACTNCHQLMEKVSVKNQLVKSTELETCFQCHKDRRAQMMKSNHMPLESGNMTCSSCHNPHGSAADKLLKEASVNETCYKCHADKRGPFLWEHEPVRDNCLNCHDPHGTVTQYMLKMQRPRLCQSCHMGPGHGNPGNPKTVQSFNRSCQNCHTLVHGSNSPAGALFQR